jgi:hypothetical protein
MLLSFDIRSPDDQRQTVKSWVNEFEILENCLEGTAFSPVVQFYFRKSCRVERYRLFTAGRLKKLIFGHE